MWHSFSWTVQQFSKKQDILKTFLALNDRQGKKKKIVWLRNTNTATGCKSSWNIDSHIITLLSSVRVFTPRRCKQVWQIRRHNAQNSCQAEKFFSCDVLKGAMTQSCTLLKLYTFICFWNSEISRSIACKTTDKMNFKVWRIGIGQTNMYKGSTNTNRSSV